jgi:hypothetical protein
MRTRVATLAAAIVNVLALGVGTAWAVPRAGGHWGAHGAGQMRVHGEGR